MGPSTRDSGNLAAHGAKESLLTPRVRSIRATGETTRRMVMAGMCTQMELNMKASGTKTCSMETERNAGPTVRFFEGNIGRVKRTGSESTSGPMVHAMRENGRITKSPDMDSISGQTAANTSVIGRATLWTSLESTLGKMVECMRVSTRMTKSMVLEFIHGQIRSAMQAGGAMANNMASVSFHKLKVH